MRRSAWGIGVVVLLATPGVARAGTVSVVSRPRIGTIVVFTAAPGEVNRVTVTTGGDDIVIADAGAPITAGAGCAAGAPGTVVCPFADRVSVRLGGGNDQATGVTTGAHVPGQVEMRGGAGDDILRGGAEPDLLVGGAGDDVVDGGDGNDVVYEGGDPGAHDQDSGGPGRDTLSYVLARTGVRVDLAAGTGGVGGADDAISGFEDLAGGPQGDVLLGDGGRNTIDGTPYDFAVDGGPAPDHGDRIDGRGGRDHLYGSSAADRIYGGAGPDSISGGGGRDVLFGGPGDDIFQPSGGYWRRDRKHINCGPGRDFFDAYGGPAILAPDCELFIMRWGSVQLRRHGRRQIVTLPRLHCALTLRLGRGGPEHAVAAPRGSHVSFVLPARAHGSIGLWGRISGCSVEHPYWELAVKLALGQAQPGT